MRIEKAYEIFENINSDKYTDQEKLTAIHVIIEMATHNSITKDNIIKAFIWFWNWCIDTEEGAE